MNGLERRNCRNSEVRETSSAVARNVYVVCGSLWFFLDLKNVGFFPFKSKVRSRSSVLTKAACTTLLL